MVDIKDFYFISLEHNKYKMYISNIGIICYFVYFFMKLLFFLEFTLHLLYVISFVLFYRQSFKNNVM